MKKSVKIFKTVLISVISALLLCSCAAPSDKGKVLTMEGEDRGDYGARAAYFAIRRDDRSESEETRFFCQKAEEYKAAGKIERYTVFISKDEEGQLRNMEKAFSEGYDLWVTDAASEEVIGKLDGYRAKGVTAVDISGGHSASVVYDTSASDKAVANYIFGSMDGKGEVIIFRPEDRDGLLRYEHYLGAAEDFPQITVVERSVSGENELGETMREFYSHEGKRFMVSAMIYPGLTMEGINSITEMTGGTLPYFVGGISTVEALQYFYRLNIGEKSVMFSAMGTSADITALALTAAMRMYGGETMLPYYAEGAVISREFCVTDGNLDMYQVLLEREPGEDIRQNLLMDEIDPLFEE